MGNFALLYTRIKKGETGSKCTNSKDHPSVLTHFINEEEFVPKCLPFYFPPNRNQLFQDHLIVLPTNSIH